MAIFAVVALGAGCGVRFHKGPLFDEIDQTKFPTTESALLALSHRSYVFAGPIKAVTISLLAAENVLTRDPDNDLANFLAARAAYWLVEFGGDGVDRAHLAELGYKYATAAESADGSKAAYPFLEGVHLGFEMREALHPPLINLRKARDYFQRAIELDALYDDAAPLRAMGILLIKSPAWPTGVGDVDEGVTYLERATKYYPMYPANHLYLAEGYRQLGQLKEAAAQLDLTFKLLETFEWGVPGEVWKKQAEAARAKLEKKGEREEPPKPASEGKAPESP
jgi:tetratricopeptide (TPR) repeat protein